MPSSSTTTTTLTMLYLTTVASFLGRPQRVHSLLSTTTRLTTTRHCRRSVPFSTLPSSSEHHHRLSRTTTQPPTPRTARYASTNSPLSSSSSSSSSSLPTGISRIETLQQLLQLTGAPGSTLCSKPNDLQPIDDDDDDESLLSLHPHLYPIARSTSNPSNYICGLRRAYADDVPEYESSSADAPWPIVESSLNGPGYTLLGLNAEHLMRRIAAESDTDDDETETETEAIRIYNTDLQDLTPPFNSPYEPGSVRSLGYGTSKYVLLRIGPFPDLYREMTKGHLARDDDQSALVAAETTHNKFQGFASTFKFYADVLDGMDRKEEARDAARTCLRLPLASVGCTEEEFGELARLAQFEEGGHDDDDDETEKGDELEGLRKFYEMIKEHEMEDESTRASMSVKQLAIEEANKVLDRVCLGGGKRDWKGVRGELGRLYGEAGMVDMARFVDPGYE